uniref:Putative capsid protein n=1 Tax=viral metagenome TaxID=1070528 RepID=A0A6M3K6T4_9ZZZZ
MIDVKPQDGMTSAFYPWTEIGGTISISRREERQNSGEAALLKLLEKKTMQAEMSMKSKVNQQLLQGTVSSSTFVPGNSAKDLLPLGYFLRYAPATDPTTGGNVGNIAASTYSWWRPKCANFASGTAATGHAFGLAVTTWAGMKVGLKRMWNHCSRGADGSGPNLVVMTQNGYESYESALDAGVRYMDTDLADLGFDNIKLKGATVIWDELVPDLYTGTTALTVGSAFFLNTKFYKLVIDSETDFITTPFIEPENQTAKTAKVLFMGQATVSNARKNGMVSRIDETLAA